MLIGSMGGLGKKGKKKWCKNVTKHNRKLSKVVKSARFLCKSLQKFDIFVF
jgi:hypothetical protein